MKNIVLFLLTIFLSTPMMSQDKLIQIGTSSYYKDSESIYFVVTNYLSNAPFFFPSSRPIIPLTDIENNGKLIHLGPFNDLGIIVTAEAFEKKYTRLGRLYHPITAEFDTHSTFAIKLPGVTVKALKDFKLLNEHYASIEDKIFFRYDELKGVDTATFQLIDIGYPEQMNFCYSKDKNSVYYYDHKIIGADVLSFEGLNKTYSRDKNSYFFKGMALNNSDVASFEMWGNYQTDDNDVWFEGKLLDNIDVKTLSVLVRNPRLRNPYLDYSDYAIDENFVFYQGKRLLKADPKTFKVILSKRNITYGIDSTYVYLDGAIIKDADPKTFNE